MTDPEKVVRFDDLHDFLAARRLRVVRAGWRWGERRPYLIVATAPAAAEPDAQPAAEPKRKDSDE